MRNLIIIIALVIHGFCLGQSYSTVGGKIFYAPPKTYNLENGDVRKCLIQAAQSEGWKLKSAYKHKAKWVIIFEKNGKIRKYD